MEEEKKQLIRNKRSDRYLACIAIVVIAIIFFIYLITQTIDFRVHSAASVKTAKRSKPLILLWTPWFSIDWPLPKNNIYCKGYDVECKLSTDRNDYHRSSAVVFHGSSYDIRSIHDYPPLQNRPAGQYWVYHNMENPILSTYLTNGKLPEEVDNLFNLTMAYTSDSDIIYRYGQVVPGKFKNGFDPKRNYAKGKTKLIAWASSQCYAERTRFVKGLNTYVDLDKFGKCGNLYCPRTDKCWRRLAREYKFYLSFENKICKDYITEKFYANAIMNDMVPIVVGGADYQDPHVAPPGSYINAFDFDDVEQLANYIKNIANDDNLYNQYFKWRANYTIVHRPMTDAFCELCNTLVNSDHPTTVYKHLTTFWGINSGNCVSYPTSRRSNISTRFKYYFKSHHESD